MYTSIPRNTFSKRMHVRNMQGSIKETLDWTNWCCQMIARNVEVGGSGVQRPRISRD